MTPSSEQFWALTTTATSTRSKRTKRDIFVHFRFSFCAHVHVNFVSRTWSKQDFFTAFLHYNSKMASSPYNCLSTTLPLYQLDTYLFKQNARVLSLVRVAVTTQWIVIFDHTIFHPQGSRESWNLKFSEILKFMKVVGGVNKIALKFVYN